MSNVTSIETDVLIIGAGITGTMVAAKLSEERDVNILVVEAGEQTTPLDERFAMRERFLKYGDNPWKRDRVPTHDMPVGANSPAMSIGGWAMHWGAVVPRFSPEDFRLKSIYGVHDDWPIDYDDLEPYYEDAERRIGSAGEQGPPEMDARRAPYPLPAMPLNWSLARLKTIGESAGIPFVANPIAKNTVAYDGRSACLRCDTCGICPTGAKYSPEYTLQALLDRGKATLRSRTLVRRLVVDPVSGRISHLEALDRDRNEALRIKATSFVLATGYVWSPHLLLLSADKEHPKGLANSSGLVGKHMSWHWPTYGNISLPLQLYPGENDHHSVVSWSFQRKRDLGKFLRHDLRIWNSTQGLEPRLRDDSGRMLVGDDMLRDWRARTNGNGAATVRGYYEVVGAKDSGITLSTRNRNQWGDPLPEINFRESQVSRDLRNHSVASLGSVFARIARAGDGKVIRDAYVNQLYDHPGGGCRMGDDPATSVTDSYGRTHDHENLFVVGAPTMVSAGCNNGTLTYSALSLRSAEKIGEAFPRLA
ncbi:MAG: GMC family oxidoreductase [Pseudomonadota bacterium]